MEAIKGQLELLNMVKLVSKSTFNDRYMTNFEAQLIIDYLVDKMQLSHIAELITSNFSHESTGKYSKLYPEISCLFAILKESDIGSVKDALEYLNVKYKVKKDFWNGIDTRLDGESDINWMKRIYDKVNNAIGDNYKDYDGSYVHMKSTLTREIKINIVDAIIDECIQTEGSPGIVLSRIGLLDL